MPRPDVAAVDLRVAGDDDGTAARRPCPLSRGWRLSYQPIELILLRRLADRLALAAALVDRTGALVHLNRPAETLFGLEVDDLGGAPLGALVKLIHPTDEEGRPIDAEHMPIAMANRERRPQQATLCINGPAQTPVRLAVTAIPLDGQGGAPLGAMSIFWEVEGASPSADGRAGGSPGR